MRTMSLGSCFDGLIAWDNFWHLCPDDQHRMFATFRAYTAPGAALMFTSGPAAGEAVGAPLYHASLGREEYRAFLDESGNPSNKP